MNDNEKTDSSVDDDEQQPADPESQYPIEQFYEED